MERSIISGDKCRSEMVGQAGAVFVTDDLETFLRSFRTKLKVSSNPEGPEKCALSLQETGVAW